MSMKERGEYPELAGLPPKRRAEALRRLRMVQELNELIRLGRPRGFRANDIATEYVRLLRTNGVHVSRGTLLHWRRCYRIDLLAGLIDRRSLRSCIASDRRRFGRFLSEVRAAWHRFSHTNYVTFAPRFELAHSLAKRESLGRRFATCSYRDAERCLRAELIRTLPDKAGATPAEEPIERP
jgi:hypothetical protein